MIDRGVEIPHEGAFSGWFTLSFHCCLPSMYLSLHTTKHPITPHHITCITTHHNSPHHITSHHITPHHITSQHITSQHPTTSHHIHITSNAAVACPLPLKLCLYVACADLVWSDPEEVDGWAISPRGAGYLFGERVVAEVSVLETLYLL